ncbi:MAG: hypothetical protein ACLS28_24050 [Clostridium neonatale]
MLENIIKQELFKYMDDKSRQNSDELNKAREEIASVAELINADNKIMYKLDEAYTLEETVYQEMYFREGFMTALRLINEINNVKVLGNTL